MNIILVVFTSVVTISAIRVPTVWPEEQSEGKHLKPLGYGSYHKKFTNNNREDIRIYPQEKRLRKYSHSYKRPHKLSKLPPRPYYFQSKPPKSFKKHRPKQSVWTPIAPYGLSTKVSSKPNISLRQLPNTYYLPSSSEYVTSRSSPLYKNYRDDKTYEYEQKDDDKITEPELDIKRPSTLQSDHAHPIDIPTAPIYPGEGQWAKPGPKYKPFVSKQKYEELSEDTEEPEGYEIFLKGKKLYDKKNKNFDHARSKIYPEKEDLKTQTEKKGYKEEIEKEESESSEEKEFIPSTMYVQVRRSEDEEHLPSDSEDSEGGRLKEVIKDSKIQTVYTEEGYEDSAYDHAGHEKEAADSQGYKEYNKEEEKEKKPTKNHKNEGDLNGDGSLKIYQKVNHPNVSKRKKFTPKNHNKLFKTESTITRKLKEQPDGTQMEITSGITKMTNPDEVVQVLPKVVKYTNANELNQFNSPNQTGILPEELPSTPVRNIRRKRFTNDFPQIDVKTDFINGIVREDHQKIYEQKEKEKYPYYTSKNINPNSPLKYSESYDNIPEKTEGRMAFYEQANRIQCPEVDEDIEAIPKRIEEVEKSVNSGEKLEDSEEAGKSPRLGKLGQRIDCFKRKYFGENPLDSPFFQEKEVPPVRPLFKVLHERSAGFQAHHQKTEEPINSKFKKKYHSKFSIRPKENHPSDNRQRYSEDNQEELDSEEIVNDVRIHQNPTMKSKNKKQYFDNEHFTPEVEVINVDTFKSINHFTTEAPSVSLITTPKYSIDITPNHIYDQIKLLEFLPSHSTAATVSITENPRKGKVVEDATETSQWQMRPNYQTYKHRRPLQIKRSRPKFNVENFVKDTSRRVTVTPNSYRSDYNIAYEQTPLDQLNVFADVINNIRNGSNDPLKVEASTENEPNQLNMYKNHGVRMRVPSKKIHIKVPDAVKYSNDMKLFYKTSTVPTTLSPSTIKTKRGSIRYIVTTEREYDDYAETEDDSQYGGKKIAVQSSTYSPVVGADVEEVDSEVSGTHTTETVYKVPIKKLVDIIGLVPPSKYDYRTIHQPLEEPLTEPVVSSSEVINNYHVVGMKPPSTKQKVYDYSEFQRLLSPKNNNHKYHNFRRGKRSPNRKSYFEVVRGQNSEDESSKHQEEEDDYVPHRPKNWHWDEKLKKIVYDNPKQEEESNPDDDEVDAEEVEVEDSIPKNIQQTTTRRTLTSTTPINGPSYVDFVQILKSKKDYISIPDPTTKKDGIEMGISLPSTTTVRAESTTPPEFLSFVSKLRQNNAYIPIEEKNKTTTTAPTTEPTEDEFEDSDTALSNVQNSPGRGAVDIGQNLKIFDVNDFLPKVKTYSPRTEIDYSKYKTIQRPRPKSTTDSSNEAETITEPNPLVIIAESEEKPLETSTEGKVEIFEVNRSTTPATTTTTHSTTTKFQKLRRRRPSTTQRSIVSSATNTKVDTVEHEKPRRVYPRRRPTHIRTRTTTQKAEDAASDESKVIIRRHNVVERNPKIISLEAIIQTDRPMDPKEQFTQANSDSTKKEQDAGVTVDEILKNINRLKEVNVEEMVSDYPDSKNEDDLESKDEYFDTDSKVSLHNGDTTNRKLVISKDKQKGMFYYTSVR